MRLIKDHRCGIGQNARVRRIASLLLDVEVGEEEVVIDDDELGLHRLSPHGRDETRLGVGAGLAQADLGPRVELRPKPGVLRQALDLGPVAGLGVALPLQDGVELLDVVQAGKDRVVAQGIQLLLANVVGTTLHDAHLQRAKQRLEEGDVFERELLLQVFGPGRDDDALVHLPRKA